MLLPQSAMYVTPLSSFFHSQVKCPAGYGSAEGSQGACTICPPGKYGLGLGLGCDKCSMGMWSPGGNTACSPCDAGKYSGTGGGWGTSTCAGSCPAGQYSVGGAIICSLVSVLSLHLSVCAHDVSTHGSTQRRHSHCHHPMTSILLPQCPVGTYSAAAGATSSSTCTACPVYTTNSVEGASACLPACPVTTQLAAR